MNCWHPCALTHRRRSLAVLRAISAASSGGRSRRGSRSGWRGHGAARRGRRPRGSLLREWALHRSAHACSRDLRRKLDRRIEVVGLVEVAASASLTETNGPSVVRVLFSCTPPPVSMFVGSGPGAARHCCILGSCVGSRTWKDNRNRWLRGAVRSARVRCRRSGTARTRPRARTAMPWRRSARCQPRLPGT